MFIIFSSSLLRQLVKEMGRKFIGLVESLPGFGIGMIIAIFHLLGYMFSWKILLNICKILVLMIGWTFFNIEYVIWSIPGQDSDVKARQWFSSLIEKLLLYGKILLVSYEIGRCSIKRLCLKN